MVQAPTLPFKSVQRHDIAMRDVVLRLLCYFQQVPNCGLKTPQGGLESVVIGHKESILHISKYGSKFVDNYSEAILW